MSKHILLTFSGFLSQNDASEDGWSHLNELVEPHGVHVYDLKWRSIDYSDIAKRVGKKLGFHLLAGAAGFLVPGGSIARLARFI